MGSIDWNREHNKRTLPLHTHTKNGSEFWSWRVESNSKHSKASHYSQFWKIKKREGRRLGRSAQDPRSTHIWPDIPLQLPSRCLWRCLVRLKPTICFQLTYTVQDCRAAKRMTEFFIHTWAYYKTIQGWNCVRLKSEWRLLHEDSSATRPRN